MPGSTTLGHGHPIDWIEHTDAVRLASVLRQLSGLLAVDGPDRLTDAQAGALCAEHPRERQEFTEWVDGLAKDLTAKVSA